MQFSNHHHSKLIRSIVESLDFDRTVNNTWKHKKPLPSVSFYDKNSKKKCKITSKFFITLTFLAIIIYLCYHSRDQSLEQLLVRSENRDSCFDLTWLHKTIFYSFIGISIFIVLSLIIPMIFY